MFTEQQLVDTVKELVKENPDFVYSQGDEPRCLYVPTEQQPGVFLVKHY